MKKERVEYFDGLNLRASVFTEEEALAYVREMLEVESIEKVFENGEYWWEIMFKDKKDKP